MTATTANTAANEKPVRRLMLFVAEGEANSVAAAANLRKICDEQSTFVFEVKRVDVLKNFRIALEHGVLVTPCLVATEPPPGVAIAGTLSDTSRVRLALGLMEE